MKSKQDINQNTNEEINENTNKNTNKKIDPNIVDDQEYERLFASYAQDPKNLNAQEYEKLFHTHLKKEREKNGLIGEPQGVVANYAEHGYKVVCYACRGSFYDLHKEHPICPYCKTIYGKDYKKNKKSNPIEQENKIDESNKDDSDIT